MKVRGIWTSIGRWRSVGVKKDRDGNIVAPKDFKRDMCKGYMSKYSR